MAEALGLIGSFLGGAGGAAENVMIRKIQGEIDDQKAQALEKARHANEIERVRLADELKRAPAKEAMAKIEKANAPVMVDDGVGGGNLQAPTKAEQRANMAKGLIESGDPSLISAGTTMSEGDLNRVERGEDRDLRERSDERRHQDVVKRLDQQFEHQKKQDSIAAGNAARMLMVAEEQVRGVKLDNDQKAQLAALDKEWTAATDDKTRENIAQRRAMLTGKWNESFEVKTGKDGLGNDMVLGYIDKRRGTFTTPDGTISDMRTGKKVGGTQEIRYDKDGNAFVRGPDGKPTPYKATPAEAPSKPAAAAPKTASTQSAGGENTAEARYKKALAELTELKGGLLMPTPKGNAAAIKAKEEEVSRLLQETYK